MTHRMDVQPGTLSLMTLTTLNVLGPLHGYGVTRRIEETSKGRLSLNYGTLYPALVKLEQEGFVTTEWRQSENNRREVLLAHPGGEEAGPLTCERRDDNEHDRPQLLR